MLNFLKSKPKWLVAVIALAILIMPATVFALTSADFAARAQTYAASLCKPSLVTSANNAKNNENNWLCYMYMKIGVHDTAISSQGNSINSLNNSVTSLNSTTSNQQSRIDTLSSSSSRVKLYDANNNLIGVEPSITQNYHEQQYFQFYNQQLGRIVSIHNEGWLRPDDISFEGLNCSGAAYYTTGRTGNPHSIVASVYLTAIKNSIGNYYVTDDSATSFWAVFRSYRAKSTGECTEAAHEGTAIRLVQVSLPFSDPISLPLSLKYQ